jgi:hypothetical protein
VAQVRRASAAMPCRTVKFTRSMKAVFSRPEKPRRCKVSSRASSVPKRITCVTCTSLRQRSALLHLAGDQAWRHLPSAPVASSTTRGKPLAKVGGESIKEQLSPSLVNSGMQPGASLCWRAWMSRWAMVWVCGPSSSAGRSAGSGIDRQPEKDESAWRCAAWCAVHPLAGAGGGD